MADGYAVKAICVSNEVAEELTFFLVTQRLSHAVKVEVKPIELPRGWEGSNSLRYEGSDERGVGTGNE